MNQWHYATGAQKHGPVSSAELAELARSGTVTPETLVWRAGMDNWLPLSQVPDAFTSAPGVSSSSTPAGQPVPIVFTGEWTEYFKIWIVNVLLTVVTFGIYAAWAKVRKRRYFCANTRLLGHSFEYLADPKKILIGNLIVAAAFFAYSVTGAISPLIQLPLMLALAVALPWFVVRALTFNARNTAWRGLRFGFGGQYAEAAKVYLLLPILMPFTLGLIYPLIVQRRKKFTVGHHFYSRTAFGFDGETGQIYRIYLKALLFFLPVVVGYGIMLTAIITTLAARGPIQNGQMSPEQIQQIGPMAKLAGLFILAGVPLAFVGTFYLRARMFSYSWNHTFIGHNRFQAAMRARDLLWLQFVNALVTFFTLGLLHPWAAVRTARYQLGCLQLLPRSEMDDFVAAAAPPAGALGESAADLLDFDLGFGA